MTDSVVGPTLVLDIGGTKIAAGLVDAKGQLLQRNQQPTPRSTDADEVWAAAGTWHDVFGIEPAVCDRLLPGYGEQMRAISLAHVPTAVLSRALRAVLSWALRASGQPSGSIGIVPWVTACHAVFAPLVHHVLVYAGVVTAEQPAGMLQRLMGLAGLGDLVAAR